MCEYEKQVGPATFVNTNPGRWCNMCGHWFNANQEGVKGREHNRPGYSAEIAYCGKCCTNENRKHKQLF